MYGKALLICVAPNGDMEVWDPNWTIDYMTGWRIELNALGSVQYCCTFGPEFWGRIIVGDL